jgi:NADH-quinone oxidoreductase subunit M
VSHFGFIALGVFAFTTQGGSGATLYMVNHGFSTGALFLVVGFLAYRRGSRSVDDFGGVQSVAPWLGAVTLVAGLSALSLPGLSTFVSEFLVLVGTFTRYRALAIVATVGIVLAAIYVLYLFQRTMTGPLKLPELRKARDLSWRESLALAPLIALIVALGVYPKPLLDTITPAVTATFQQAGHTDPHPTAATASGAHP